MIRRRIMRRKRQTEKERTIYQRLAALAAEHHAKILSFSYDPQIFGNITVSVEYHGNAFSFDTDRGEIYCNNRFVCDNSYHEAGCSDTVDQLLKVIEKSVFQE